LQIHREPSLRIGALLLTLLSVTAGCNPSRNLFLAGLPGVETRFRVVDVDERYGLLDVHLMGVGHDTRLRTFLPARPDCRAVVADRERVVRFESTGPAGALASDGAACDAVGIGSLADWRARRPDPVGLGATPIPREPASWRRVYADEETILLRGDFPLASLVGWTYVGDAIAVLPNRPPCREVAERQAGSLEYHPSGRPVLALVGDGGDCPIEGLVQPRARS